MNSNTQFIFYDKKYIEKIHLSLRIEEWERIQYMLALTGSVLRLSEQIFYQIIEEYLKLFSATGRKLMLLEELCHLNSAI